jgi:hypothetical protein
MKNQFYSQPIHKQQRSKLLLCADVCLPAQKKGVALLLVHARRNFFSFKASDRLLKSFWHCLFLSGDYFNLFEHLVIS